MTLGMMRALMAGAAGFVTAIVFVPLAFGAAVFFRAADFGRTLREMGFALRPDAADILFFAAGLRFLEEARAGTLLVVRLFTAMPEPSG
jgi:hypothetical protein